MENKKSYRAPEIMALGKATTLTLGSPEGCGFDDYLCKYKAQVE